MPDDIRPGTAADDRYEKIDHSPAVSDEIKKTTCYMCACRCGIEVHLDNGKIRYIGGNRKHPVNRGVLCGKGSAGIMQHYSPARLRKPLLRTGERGSGEFREIEWDEALKIATDRLANIRATDPKKLAFFTGRDQSQSLTGWWASRFGTPNFAAHGGFCSVNMAVAGLYTIGGSFWEFGEPDWDHARYFLLFGVAEDHDSNPIKIGTRQAEGPRQAKVVSVNPGAAPAIQRGRRRMGRHQARHRRPVRLALVHELLRPARSIWISWSATRTPPAGDPRSGRRRRRPLPARCGGEPHWPGTQTASRLTRPPPSSRPALAGQFIVPTAAAVPAFQLLPNAISTPATPEAVAETRGSPPTPSAGSPPNWPMPPLSRRSPSTFPGPTGPGASMTR